MTKTIVLSLLSFASLADVSVGRLLAAPAPGPSGSTAENACFKPLVEAPLPDGFPTYT